MSVLSLLGCLTNHHRPFRRKVTWNGQTYIGQCRHCGAPIERHGHRNWRKRKQSATERDAPTPV